MFVLHSQPWESRARLAAYSPASLLPRQQKQSSPGPRQLSAPDPKIDPMDIARAVILQTENVHSRSLALADANKAKIHSV